MPRRKKRKLGWPLTIGALVLAGGGAVAWWLKKKNDEKLLEKAAAAALPTSTYQEMPPTQAAPFMPGLIAAGLERTPPATIEPPAPEFGSIAGQAEFALAPEEVTVSAAGYGQWLPMDSVQVRSGGRVKVVNLTRTPFVAFGKIVPSLGTEWYTFNTPGQYKSGETFPLTVNVVG